MAKLAPRRRSAPSTPRLTRVLGGISPIDPHFIRTWSSRACSTHVDAVAVHGFPLDWNHWQIDEWPDKLAEIRAVTPLPVWISEVGVSTFGAEEVQEFGLRARPSCCAATRRAFTGTACSTCRGVARDDAASRGRGLVVLPALLHGPVARGRHAEARAAHASPSTRRSSAICQWFHFEDPPPRGRRALAERAGRDVTAHRPQLG